MIINQDYMRMRTGRQVLNYSTIRKSNDAGLILGTAIGIGFIMALIGLLGAILL